MGCERCLSGDQAGFRVSTDAVDMRVCKSCAEEARELGLAIETLNSVSLQEQL